MQILRMQTSKETKELIPKFELEIKDMSQIIANVAFNPNRDVVEDRPKLKEYTRQQISIMISKMVINIYKIADIEELEKLVFYFKYPMFSNFLRIIIVLFLLFFEPAYLISYVVGIFTIVFIFQNEAWHPYTMSMLSVLFEIKNPFISILASINPSLDEFKGSKIVTFKQDSLKTNTKTIY